MAVENEVKYVIGSSADHLEALLDRSAAVRQDIEQAYLDKDTRIRRFVARDGTVEYVFSFKRKVDGEAIEVETPISEDDFLALAPTAITALFKRRYKLRDGAVAWDVDFLKLADETYFALAEAEMPRGMAEPPRIHPLVVPHVIWFGGRKRRFSNRRLSDPAHAAKVMADIRTSLEAYEVDDALPELAFAS